MDNQNAPKLTGSSVTFETIDNTSTAQNHYWEIVITSTDENPFNIDNIDVMIPESGSAWMYLLLAGAACPGAMFFGSRNQMNSQA